MTRIVINYIYRIPYNKTTVILGYFRCTTVIYKQKSASNIEIHTSVFLWTPAAVWCYTKSVEYGTVPVLRTQLSRTPFKVLHISYLLWCWLQFEDLFITIASFPKQIRIHSWYSINCGSSWTSEDLGQYPVSGQYQGYEHNNCIVSIIFAQKRTHLHLLNIKIIESI